MSLAPLRIAAAEFALDATDSDKLRQVADEALTRGVYSYSLGELGTATNPTYWVIRPLMAAAMRELGIPIPSEQEAVRSLLFHHLGRIVEGAVSPERGVNQVRRLLDPYRGAAEQVINWVEASDRVRSLMWCYYRYDYDESTDALAELNLEVVQYASDWIAICGRKRIDRSWLAWNDGAIRKMAQAIRDNCRFSDLPLLGDALEEAGCGDVELLEHCRERTPHVSDCWVIQLLLAAD